MSRFTISPAGKLQENKYTWTQAANIIFLESPAFVGWSYSNTSSDLIVGTGSHQCTDLAEIPPSKGFFQHSTGMMLNRMSPYKKIVGYLLHLPSVERSAIERSDATRHRSSSSARFRSDIFGHCAVQVMQGQPVML